MRRIRISLSLAYFSFLSLILALFFLLLRRTPEFTMTGHYFRPALPDLVIPAVLIFILLVGLWAILSRIQSGLFRLGYAETLSLEFWTYVPLIFFGLALFALTHYISSEDLASRIRLFSVAGLISVLYLKGILILRWSGEKPNPLRRLWEKFLSFPTKKKALILFAAALLILNTGSFLMLSEGHFFSGDEPHFLLISHSILHDRDFDLANNYEQRDYTRFMLSHATIRPHLAPGIKGKGQYSFHSPGISLLLLPFYALGSLFGKEVLVFLLRFGISLFGALLGLQIFLYAREEWKKEEVALALWSVFTFTSAVFFYSFHIYPEIVVALFSFMVFRIFRSSRPLSPGKLLLCGFLLSTLIWFHALKYITLFLPFLLYCLWTIGKHHKRRRDFLYFLTPLFFSLVLYFYFQYSLYGSFSLSSISVGGVMSGKESLSYMKSIFFDIPLRFRWESLAGYFFDQRDGLLFYSPLYFFAFLGLVEMVRRKRKDFLLLLFLAAPFILNYAFMTQRAGYAPQARPLVPVIWALAILLGHFLSAQAKKIFRYLFNGAVLFSFLAVFILLKNPLALYQETTVGQTERGGELFYLLSNLHFQLTKFLPSYIKVEEWKWLPNFVWIGVLLLFIGAYIGVKKHSFSLRFGHHVSLACGGMVLFFVWMVLYPRPVLLYPVKASYPSGERVTFYALSRVGRMVEPGRFLLREDNRSYVFYFTSWREVQKFEVELGSLAGDYSVELSLFDEKKFMGRTEREVKTLSLAFPARYRLKNSNLYRITIHLERLSEVSTPENPYLFSIRPVN